MFCLRVGLAGVALALIGVAVGWQVLGAAGAGIVVAVWVGWPFVALLGALFRGGTE